MVQIFEVLMICERCGVCTAVSGLGMVNVRVTVVMVAMVATEVSVWGGVSASADVGVGKWCIELNAEKRRSEVAETM